MSKVRTNSPIEDIDKIAKEVGIKSLETADDGARTFEAFGRVFRIREATPGKVGVFSVSSKPKGHSDDAAYEGMENHDRIRLLFRRAVKWREGVA